MSPRTAFAGIGLLASVVASNVFAQELPGLEWQPLSESELSLAFGPQEDGGFGSNLKADLFYSPDQARVGDMFAGYLGLKGDAHWSSADEALNQSSLSLQLGVWTMLNGAGFMLASPAVELYVDVRQRYGQFQDGAGGEIENVDHTLTGLGAEFQVPGSYILLNWLSRLSKERDQPPIISVTHYWNRDQSDQAQDLPDALKADELLVQLHGQLTVPKLKLADAPVRLQYEFGFTKPTTGNDRAWQDFTKLALVIDAGDEIKPALIYSRGEQDGLEYDKRLLLGLLWSFGKSEGAGSEEAAAPAEPVQIVPPVESPG
ncbi:MAG: hypothetical protein Q8Q73_19460 [Stagnimonas sp.]|nr:hypothetical protein [Stagnimonas sp.]